MSIEYPILESNDDSEAIIEPGKVFRLVEGIPERCILPIYSKVINKLVSNGLLIQYNNKSTLLGKIPVYTMKYKETEFTVVFPGIGAPHAAGIMEELIAYGCRKFIACGAAGVLDSGLSKGTVVVPDAAVRDEGTSYHYIAANREIKADPEVVKIIESVLKAEGIDYNTGKTWTTDGLYRETKQRIEKRKSEGCLAVEMECSAFLAVAQFRGVRFGQILSTADDISGDEWDPRYSKNDKSFAEKIFWLSAEACFKL